MYNSKPKPRTSYNEHIPVICSKCGNKITSLVFRLWQEQLSKLKNSKCPKCGHTIKNYKIVLGGKVIKEGEIVELSV